MAKKQWYCFTCGAKISDELLKDPHNRGCPKCKHATKFVDYCPGEKKTKKKDRKKEIEEALAEEKERIKKIKEGKIQNTKTYTLPEEDIDLAEMSTFWIGEKLMLQIFYEHDGRQGRDHWRYELSEGTTTILDEISTNTPSKGSKNIFAKLRKIIMEKYQVTETKAEEYIVRLKKEFRDVDWALFYSKKEEEKGIADIYAIKALEQTKILNTVESIKKGWEYLSRNDFIDLFCKELSYDYIIGSKRKLIHEFLSIFKTIIPTLPSSSVLSGGSATGKSETIRNAMKGMPEVFLARASNLTSKAPYYLQDAFGSARALLIFDSDLNENDPLLKLSRQISIDDEGCSILVTTPVENDIATVTRVTLSREIKAVLSTSTRINYEKQFSTRVDRISIESSYDKIYRVGRLKLGKKEKFPWDRKEEQSFRPDNDNNWLLRALWIPLIFKTTYILPGISKLADYQPITHARATRDIDKAIGDIEAWAMLHMSKITWIRFNDEIVGIVPPDIWLEGLAYCNYGLLETYLERDERTKKVITSIKKLDQTKENREFATKDVCRTIGLERKEVYTILNNLENDGIINKTEEARGSKPAKYEYLSDIRRNGYFEFSQKIKTQRLNKEYDSNDFNPIERTDPEAELKNIYENAWKEFNQSIEEYKDNIISELSIPVFSTEMRDFGVYLYQSEESEEYEDTTKNRKNNKNIKDTTPHKTAFVGVCVCVPEHVPHSSQSSLCKQKFNALKEKFGIFPKDFDAMTYEQQKKTFNDFIIENTKASYKITHDFLFSQKKIPHSFITQCIESDLLQKDENDEYSFGGSE